MTYQITLSPQGQQFPARPEDTLLDAAQNAGWLLPHGCRNGGCGVCKCTLVSGEIEHIGTADALTDEDRARGLILPCQAHPRSDVTLQPVRVQPANLPPSQKLPARVAALEQLCDAIMAVRLQLPASAKFTWLPGQYIDILLPDGKRRSFSLANAPQSDGPTHLELHIGRIAGGQFTNQVFETMKVKDMLRIEGPLGDFYLRDGDAPLILIAGGTGFAPIKAILDHLAAQGPNTRPIHLYRGARTAASLYLNEIIPAWQQTLQQLTYVPVLSEADTDAAWTGRRGLVHHAVLEDFPSLAGHEVYACGAPGMVEAARRDFTQTRNLPEAAFYSDAFSFAQDANKTATASSSAT